MEKVLNSLRGAVLFGEALAQPIADPWQDVHINCSAFSTAASTVVLN